MAITKITVTGLNAANMGNATDADAAGYRAWLEGELKREFQGAEIELIEQDTTYGVAVDVDGADDHYDTQAAVQEFTEDAWDRCAWEWVETPFRSFLVEANGTIFGVYKARSEQGARDVCAVDAGYKSEADMTAQMESPSELMASDVTHLVAQMPEIDESMTAVSRDDWLRMLKELPDDEFNADRQIVKARP